MKELDRYSITKIKKSCVDRLYAFVIYRGGEKNVSAVDSLFNIVGSQAKIIDGGNSNDEKGVMAVHKLLDDYFAFYRIM